MSDFKTRLKELRNDMGLTQRQLAEKLNMGASTIALYETGQRNPDPQTLQKLANFFQCSVDYLLGRSDIRNLYIPDDYREKYKITRRDMLQYEDFIQHAGAFFMNDEVAEEDKEKLFRDISELFWESKEINKKKYGRKNKKPSPS